MKVLIVCGDGINCEVETAEAFQEAGFQTQIRHLNDLIAERFDQSRLAAEFSVVALPGGFSFGDDLQSGKILALKISHGLGWDLNRFAKDGGWVLGVCNGFQALIRLGVFGRDLSIMHNASGKFLNTWVELKREGDRCLWLKGIQGLPVPIRHGEGRIVLKEGITARDLIASGTACLTYQTDPNGSAGRIAGLTDETGRILGLMPHPEAFIRAVNHPTWTRDLDPASPGLGLQIFKNAFEQMKTGKFA
ncbi:MAG: phosphoribosylformylglycinamidine synthase subunit PurQ [Bdellovibrionales bacterium]|nr:phosphoribosylformylglycinamidine synthase subunit PurQ [Bdellovibrionales bacterium]